MSSAKHCEQSLEYVRENLGRLHLEPKQTLNPLKQDLQYFI